MDVRLHRLGDDANHATEGGSDGHGGNEDPCRYLASIRDDDERCPDDRGEEQGVDVAPLREGPVRPPTLSSSSEKQDGESDALAEVLVVASSLALLEQDLQRLRHVDPQEPVQVPNDGGDGRESDGLCDAVLSEVLAAEGGDLQVELDDEGAVETL